MYAALNYIRILFYITSIILLISSIITKNKFIIKYNSQLSICLLIYYGLDLIILPEILGVDFGWGALTIGFFSFISSIILLITILYNNSKIKKVLNQNSNFFINNYFKLIILPFIFLLLAFAQEVTLLNNAEMIITFEYNIGIINTEVTQLAVNKENCNTFTISKNYKLGHYITKSTTNYDIEESDNGDIIISSEYFDPELNNIDIELAKKIYKDDKYKKSSSAIQLYEDDEEIEYKGILTKLDDTNYYIIDHLISKKDSGGGTLLGSAIYYKDVFIDNIEASGNIENIYLY